MKILFVACRWDPRNPDDGAGVNYNAYTVLKEYTDDLEIVGPFEVPLTIFERGARKISSLLSQKRFVKFYPSFLRHTNEIVQKKIDQYQPDLIFAKSSVPLVNVDVNVPFLYMCDSTVKWTWQNWPEFTQLGYWIMTRWEKKVIQKASHIITFSHANGEMLTNVYGKPDHQVTVHPIPSAIPESLCGKTEQTLSPPQPLKLVLVGRVFHRKGVDIAIKAARLLNQRGIPTQLRVVGQSGDDSENVRFMGLYKKTVPDELQAYIENYRWAHFMIFPSRFDAAGIVPSEAAGFGVPTITNASGGLGTTVENNVSGIVLPKDSPAESYADTIAYYWQHPEEYQELRNSTFEHYQNTLNWQALGQKMMDIIKDLVPSH